jgi:DNA-binding XRE family transcriptional regulator
MAPDDIKTLRAELRCSTRELATALGIDQDAVLSWERGDTFPTKQWVEKMSALRSRGPDAIPRRPKRGSASTPLGALRDPEVWSVVRKLLAHPALLSEVKRLSAAYDDPDD